MGSLIGLAILWVISPLALIPLLIVFGSQNSALKKKIKELEGRQITGTVRQAPPVQMGSQSQQPRPMQAAQTVPQPQQAQPIQSAQTVPQPQQAQPVYTAPQSQPVQQPVYAATAQQSAYVRPVPKPRKKINTMNIVFIIGVIFIVVAGLIFATTTWKILPNIVKAAIIALLIVLFFAASVFARKKLHLQQTGLTFYSLGSLFIPLAFLGIGYFELLGEYLSVHGDGKYLLALFAFLCLTAACAFGTGIYRSKLYIWLTYLSGTAAVVSFVWLITPRLEMRGLILALYCLVVILISDRIRKEEHLFLAVFSKYAYMTYYAVSVVLLIVYFVEGMFADDYLWILSLAFILAAMSYMILKCEQKWMLWIHPFIAGQIVIGLAYTVPLVEEVSMILGGIGLFGLFLCYRFLRYQGKLLFRSKVSDILFIVLCLNVAIWASYPWVRVTISILCMMMLWILGCEKKENWLSKTAKFLFPWSTVCVLVCFVLAIEPLSETGVFMIYYLFMMLFTILIMLVAKRESISRRFVLPLSIMLWICGVFMAFFNYTEAGDGYVSVYLWLLTLYAMTALYEKIQTFHKAGQSVEPEQSAKMDQPAVNREGLVLARIWLYVLGTIASCAICATLYEVLPEWRTEARLCIPMGLVAILLVAYMIPFVQKKTGILKRETGLTLVTLLHVFAVLTTLEWCDAFIVVSWIGYVILIATILCQWALYRQGNTAAGFVSMIVFFATVLRLLSDTGLQYHAQTSILAVVFLVLLVIGRWLYPRALDTERRQENALWRFDWVSISAVYVPLRLFFADELWRFIGVFLLILYVLNFLKRIGKSAEKSIYSIAVMLLCVAWWAQPFLDLPGDFAAEINMIPFLLAVFVLYKVIWRGQEKIVSWVWFASVAVCFLWQQIAVALNYGAVDIFIFMCGMLVIAAWALISKSQRYSLLSLVLLVCGLGMAERIDVSALTWISIDQFLLRQLLRHLNCLMLVIGVAICLWTMYRCRKLWAGVVPVGVLFAVYAKWMNLLEFDTNIKMIAWILLYLSMLLFSYLLHHGKKIVCIEEKIALIDWYTIFNIVPTMFLLTQDGDSVWHFCGLIMLALYLLFFYRRINEKMDRPILTAAAFVICIAWWTQPFFLVPLMIRSEWKMLPLILFSLGLYKGIWRAYEKAMSWVFCATVAVCMIWQGIDAISGKVLSDVLILGVAALVILVVSFWVKSKRWFLLAGITLVTLIIYISKDFWLSLAWWIYLLAVGVILIALASVNEYYKKKGEQHESKIKRLMQEWEW